MSSDHLNDSKRFLIFGGGENRNERFDDAGFFACDLRKRMAQPFFVIMLNVGDHAGQRRDDIGGVQASAQAGFPNDDVAILLGEPAKSHDGDNFKKGGVLALGKFLK